MDPDGDFVEIPPLRNADTVIITDDELDNIRSSYDDYDDDYGDDDGYDDDEDDDDDYGDDRYDDDDEEYDDDDYDGRKGADEEVNPRMNKVMKILTIVVALIIVFHFDLCSRKSCRNLQSLLVRNNNRRVSEKIR